MKSIDYFNQLRGETHFQAFEVEDVVTRQNFVISYNPHKRIVIIHDSSINKSKIAKFIAKDGFQLQNGDKRKFDNVYDYFIYLYKKSIHEIEDLNGRNIFFMGWVNPLTHIPFTEDCNYYTCLSDDKNKLISEKLDIKMDYFIDSIIPKKYQEEFKKNAYFAGGCLSVEFGAYDTVNDYDIFIKDIDLNKEFIDFLVDKYNKLNCERLSKPLTPSSYNNLYNFTVTSNAITFIPCDSQYNSTYQIILKDSGNPIDVLSRFDFVHSMLAYDYQDKFVYSDYNIISTCQTKLIKYNSSCNTPISSLQRALKFSEKGMHMSMEQNGYIIKSLFKMIKEDKITYKDIEELLVNGYYDSMIRLDKLIR